MCAALLGNPCVCCPLLDIENMFVRRMVHTTPHLSPLVSLLLIIPPRCAPPPVLRLSLRAKSSGARSPSSIVAATRSGSLIPSTIPPSPLTTVGM